MKKYITAVLVLVLVLVVAPWGIGRLAQKRIDAGLEQLVKQAPYLSIADRKYSAGWFRSEQEVTFEVSNSWTRLLKGLGTQASAASSGESATGTPPEQPETEAKPAASEQPLIPPLRFTVRNEILHGPVLWPASFGLARVNTKFVLSDEVRKSLEKTFGTDEPVRFSTRVGFFGGGTTTVSGDGHTIKIEKEKGELAYDPFRMDFGYSKNSDHMDLDGKFPRIEITGADGQKVLFTNMNLTSTMERIHGDLYDSDFRFGIEKLRIHGKGESDSEVADVHYDLDTVKDGNFVSLAAKVGSGKFKSAEFDKIKLEINEIHYDFTVRRLDAATLEQLIAAVKASYNKPMSTTAEIESAIFSPYKQYGVALLKFDPELSLDRVGVVTPEGEGVIKGVIKLKGATEQDFTSENPAGLVGKIEVDVTIEVAQKLVEKIPNGATGVGVAIDKGYAKRDGERIVSHIEFNRGELKINGKPQALPGSGGPGAGHSQSE